MEYRNSVLHQGEAQPVTKMLLLTETAVTTLNVDLLVEVSEAHSRTEISQIFDISAWGDGGIPSYQIS
jgi:hypothetical protein